MKKSKTLKLLAANLTLLIILVICLELTLGGWVFSKNQLNFFGVSRNMDVQFEIDIYTDTMISVQHTRDKYGLRGQRSFNQPDKIDILAIGGSTTFQKYINDDDTWDSILEQKLNESGKDLVIANAGINGHSTHAHIKAFDIWLKKIEELSPRYIMFYIGVNDFLPRPFLMPGNEDSPVIKAALQENSVIYNSLRRAKGAYLARKNKFEVSKVNFSEYTFSQKSYLTESYRTFYLKQFVPAFKERLQKLIELSLSMGAEPIFITQPMAMYQLKNGELTGLSLGRKDFVSGQELSGIDSYELINYINDGIREVCGEKHLVVELTSLQVWEQSDFHDWFHNTPQGTQKVADEIWKQLDAHLE